MSTFDSLNTALTALYAQRRALDVTGQNIANANTDGYSRQRADMVTLGAPAVPAMWSTYQGTGSGVSVSSIERIRNQFLESRGHTEHAKSASLSVRQSVFDNVQQVFNEPSDSGLQEQMTDFWSGWHAVANAPTDAAARAAVVEKGATLADSLNTAHTTLSAQWGSLREEAGSMVEDVNATAANIADLNQAIIRATKAGLSSNELADQRDLQIMHLAETVGATVKAGQEGGLDVYVGGTAIVHGAVAEKMAISGTPTTLDQARGDGTVASPGVPVAITWARDGYPVSLTGGSLTETVASMNTTLPGYANQLDAFAANLAKAVNDVHAGGYPASGPAAGDFFGSATGGAITAASITVAVDESGVAVSSTSGQVDGAPATAIANIGAGTTPVHDAAGNVVDGPDLQYRKLVTALGVRAQTVNNQVKIQRTTTDQVDAARESEAGVNIDEEMVNMLAYQHAYQAASRVLTTVDETLDTLINRTGLVGR